MNYTTVTNLRWADAQNTFLNCTVTFDAIGAVPFTASASDSTDHAQEIFSRAVAGDFGAITAYQAPAFDKTGLGQAIDDACRAAIAPRLPFLEEYKQRESEALDFKNAGYTGAVPERVSEFATPAGVTAEAATDLILQQAAAMRADFSSLAALRMRKYEVLRATDDAQAQSSFDNIMAQIAPIAVRLA